MEKYILKGSTLYLDTMNAVFRIYDILAKRIHKTVGIQVYCLMIEGSGSGSIPLTNGSGSGSGRPKKHSDPDSDPDP
jgi:hypothetical protein